MPPSQQPSVPEANTLAQSIFGSAKNRQLFGVDWKTMDAAERIAYVKSFFGMEVWKHQEEPLRVLTDPYEKRITYNAARQSGKSQVLTWLEPLCAIHNTHPALDNVTHVIGLANKASQAQIVGGRIRNLLTANVEKTKFFWDREGSTMGHIIFRRDAGTNTRETGTIDFMTANPRAFSEGVTASLVVVDEANRLDSRVLSEVITPYLGSTGGTMVLTGVSRGRGAFYDACNSKDYTHLHYPWDLVETYRRSSPCDVLMDDGRVFETGVFVLEQMPLALKKALYPTNPLVHVLEARSQRERTVKMWDLPSGVMSEDDFKSQYGLIFLSSVLALLQLRDCELMFEAGHTCLKTWESRVALTGSAWTVEDRATPMRLAPPTRTRPPSRYGRASMESSARCGATSAMM